MNTRKLGLLLALALASGASHAQSSLQVYSDDFGGPNQSAPADAVRDTSISMGVPRLHAVVARLRRVENILDSHPIPPHGHGGHTHPPPPPPPPIVPRPPLCADVAPAGYLGTVIPMQSADPNASCFVALGALCADVAPAGYLGTVIPMQSADPNASCFVAPGALCADVAPAGYVGIVIPMQSSNPVGACFERPPPLCANVAPPGYVGTVILMQSSNPAEACHVCIAHTDAMDDAHCGGPPPPLLVPQVLTPSATVM